MDIVFALICFCMFSFNKMCTEYLNEIPKKDKDRERDTKKNLKCMGLLFIIVLCSSGVPRNFFRGGVQQIQLRTEDRENGDLGAVAP